MQSYSNRILAGIIAVTAIVAFSLWFFDSRSIPKFNVKAIPKHAPTLNEADIEKILRMDNFRIVRRVRQVPVAVKESFSNFTELPFDLVDPGEAISSDAMFGARSSRRLVFLGLSSESAVLVYEQGGFVGTCNAVVFWYGDGGNGWAASLHRRPTDISSFKAVFQKRMFDVWEHQN